MNPNALSIALYQEISKANEPRIFKSWHASSIAACPRAHYFQRLAVPVTSTATAAKMLRWEAGHVMEGVIRPYLVKLFPDLKSNVRIYNKEFDLTGEYDNFVPSIAELLEIKSVHDRAVRYRKVTEDRHNLKDDRPYLAHEWQQHAYVLLIQGQSSDPVAVEAVKGITYIYITLGGLLVPYSTPVKESIFNAVKLRLMLLNAAWASKTPPACVCRDSDELWASKNQFCDYRDASGGECCSLKLLKVEAK